MNEKEKYPEENVYELFSAGPRFVMLADATFQKHGKDPEEIPEIVPLEVTFPRNPRDKHHKILKGILTTVYGDRCGAYMLEYYANTQRDTRPLSRFIVTIDDDGIPSPILMVDDNMDTIPLDKKAAKKAAHQALSVLSAEVPDTARELLSKLFDPEFENVVGSYIWSDAAVRKAKLEVDEQTAQFAVAAFTYSIEDIQNEVIEESRVREPKEKYPQPAYTESVIDAAVIKPYADKHNHYKKIDLEKVTARAARSIGKKWKYIVEPYKVKEDEE